MRAINPIMAAYGVTIRTVIDNDYIIMKLEIYDNIDKLHYEVLTERSFLVAECLVYVLFFIKRNKSLITITCVIKQKLFYSKIFLLFFKISTSK